MTERRSGTWRNVVGLALAVSVVGCAGSSQAGAPGAGPASTATVSVDASREAEEDAALVQEQRQLVLAACQPAVERVDALADRLRGGASDVQRLDSVTDVAQRCVDAASRAHRALSRADADGHAARDTVVEVRRLSRQVQDHVAELDAGGRGAEQDAGQGTDEEGPARQARDLRRLAEDLDVELRQLA